MRIEASPAPAGLRGALGAPDPLDRRSPPPLSQGCHEAPVRRRSKGSRRDVNFFSTVSNAADVNKRVLHARDARGVVAGRCLLALTPAGEVLTFHPYAHDPALGFRELAAAFAADLARAVGTAVVARGEVERLVAPDWYDDGPEDLGEPPGRPVPRLDLERRATARRP